ncbi:MAG TPA: tRNA threonylcarbamoyladenosine dehydratase [Bacteroidales bacterium]|nr:tRNA threonylcarbamoyladenosine dehydratase [Bacteroidales bacterium]
MDWTQRTSLLIGDQALEKLQSSCVLIVGLGGVGAYAAEFLARAGVGRLILVDGDKVQATNRNRQLPALCSTEGRFKVVVVAERLRDINPAIGLDCFPFFLEEEEVGDLLFGRNRYDSRRAQQGIGKIFAGDDRKESLTPELSGQSTMVCDFVVDAIDSLGPKAALIRSCLEHAVPLVSSMGAAAKLDPSQISTCDISKTHHCALARALRHRLAAFGIRKGFPVVFSSEQAASKTRPSEAKSSEAKSSEAKTSEVKLSEARPFETKFSEVKSSEAEASVKVVPGTISYLPAAFACHLAAYTIKYLISENSSTNNQPD